MRFEKIDHLDLIRISGSDASNFLQGQLTNDVTKLDSLWQFSGYCNPKGRLLALLRIWSVENYFYILLESQLTDAVIKRLRMYVMRSKVIIESLEQSTVMGMDSIGALAEIAPLLAKQLPHKQPVVAERPLIQNERSFALVGHESIIFVSLDKFSKLPKSSTKEPSYCWQDQLLLAGIPEIGPATSELFVPQMINLDILSGISFRKGCYTGQEIIARMHYLGKLKQRMFLCALHGDAHSAALAGDKLYAGSATSQANHAVSEQNALGRQSGTLVSISSCGRHALAVIRLADREESLSLKNGQSVQISVQQPYPIDG